MNITRQAVLLASLFAPLLGGLGSATAQDFPIRAITVTVPFTAGGPTDVIARLTAEAMGRELNQTVVVENVTGAGGTIAAARVAQARPDGYTLLFHHIGHATTATLYRTLPYDVQTSFAPLGLVSNAAMTLVARPDFPAGDLPGLMREIRAQGDKLNLGHAGLGGANQLCGMLVQAAAGTAMTTIAYRGSAPAITELVAGRLDVFCDQATNTVPFIRDGRIKAYAVSSAERVPGLDLPTTAEAGTPAIAMSTWHGLYAPAATPEVVLERLSAALRAALRDPKVVTRLAELVTDPAPQEQATRAFHRRFLMEEVARWRPIIQAAGQYAD